MYLLRTGRKRTATQNLREKLECAITCACPKNGSGEYAGSVLRFSSRAAIAGCAYIKAESLSRAWNARTLLGFHAIKKRTDMSIYDVPASVIKDIAEELKKIDAIKPPDWARFVKTGGDRERKPESEDWWYVRSASILRKIRIHGPVGIPTLRREYGGKKNRGHNPEAVRRGSGAVIRNIIHQLEKAELLKKTKEGRIATSKGIALLDRISHKVVTQVSEVEKDAGRPRGAKEEKAVRAPAKTARRKGERRAKAAR